MLRRNVKYIDDQGGPDKPGATGCGDCAPRDGVASQRDVVVAPHDSIASVRRRSIAISGKNRTCIS